MYISIKSIESESRIIQRELNFFSVRKFILLNIIRFLEGLMTHFKKRVDADLDRVLIHLSGIIAVTETYTPEQAKNELKIVKSVIPIYRKAKNKLEQINYFDDAGVEFKIKECLVLLQDIDIQLRKKAHSERRAEKISTGLNNAMVSNSMLALSNSLN